MLLLVVIMQLYWPLEAPIEKQAGKRSWRSFFTARRHGEARIDGQTDDVTSVI